MRSVALRAVAISALSLAPGACVEGQEQRECADPVETIPPGQDAGSVVLCRTCDRACETSDDACVNIDETCELGGKTGRCVACCDGFTVAVRCHLPE